MTPSELAALLQSDKPPRLLDVREPEEHQLVALPGATLIPLRELPARLEDLSSWKDQPLVVYCHHGIRSLHAAQALEASGFEQVYNLSGGIDRWSVEVDTSAPRY